MNTSLPSVALSALIFANAIAPHFDHASKRVHELTENLRATSTLFAHSAQPPAVATVACGFIPSGSLATSGSISLNAPPSPMTNLAASASVSPAHR